MKKILKIKAMLCLVLAVIMITLLQSYAFANTENIQMIKKSDNEYLIYVSALLDQEFEFAFSNNSDELKKNLEFNPSAKDELEEGANNIAYVDSSNYDDYFKDDEKAYLWVKQGEEYKLEAEEVILSDALTETEIQELNKVTDTIKVSVGEKILPTETIDGVKVSHKIGTLVIEEPTGTYSYKMVKASSDTDAKNLIDLAEKLNKVSSEDTDIFTKLHTYNEFKDIYNQLKPEIDDEGWEEVEENIVDQPQDSKTGEQYLVWLKQETENGTIIDVQIMTCVDEYIPEYEEQEIVIKETTRLPITGDNIVLFVIAGVILVLIIAVVVLKLRNKKETK